MSKTKERSASEKATSPTPVAPVLVGFDGSDGGRDALELADVETTCPVLVVPHKD